MNQDMAYGFRMLVDIAERSLADSYEDPTTAVPHRPPPRPPPPAGPTPVPIRASLRRRRRRRLVLPTMSWDGYVALAFDEIRQVGAGSPQVPRRLRAALEDLMTVVPAHRQSRSDASYCSSMRCASDLTWPTSTAGHSSCRIGPA